MRRLRNLHIKFYLSLFLKSEMPLEGNSYRFYSMSIKKLEEVNKAYTIRYWAFLDQIREGSLEDLEKHTENIHYIKRQFLNLFLALRKAEKEKKTMITPMHSGRKHRKERDQHKLIEKTMNLRNKQNWEEVSTTKPLRIAQDKRFLALER